MGRREGRRIISVPSLVTRGTYSLSPLFSTGHISIGQTLSFHQLRRNKHSGAQQKAEKSWERREFPPTITSSESSLLEGHQVLHSSNFHWRSNCAYANQCFAEKTELWLFKHDSWPKSNIEAWSLHLSISHDNNYSDSTMDLNLPKVGKDCLKFIPEVLPSSQVPRKTRMQWKHMCKTVRNPRKTFEDP